MVYLLYTKLAIKHLLSHATEAVSSIIMAMELAITPLGVPSVPPLLLLSLRFAFSFDLRRLFGEF